jgi:hypothetical protein
MHRRTAALFNHKLARRPTRFVDQVLSKHIATLREIGHRLPRGTAMGLAKGYRILRSFQKKLSSQFNKSA